jgi:hypothetical protein
MGGLIRLAKQELRFLDTGFFGLGYPHWGIEALAEAFKKFFSHYGTKTAVVIRILMSVEILTMVIGVSTQPFLQRFDQYGSRATDGFCKCLWENLTFSGLD